MISFFSSLFKFASGRFGRGSAGIPWIVFRVEPEEEQMLLFKQKSRTSFGTAPVNGKLQKAWPVGIFLTTQAQTLDQIVVFGEICPFKVIQQFAAATGHLDQSAAGMEILAMAAEVIRQVIDPGGKKGHLDLTGAGVAFVRFVIGDDLSFID